MPVKTQIQIRRGDFASWSGVNPVPANGELTLDTTNKLLKAGDGLTNWLNLPYIGVNEEDFEDILRSLLAGASGIGIDHQDPNDKFYIQVTGIDSTQINDLTEAVQDIIGTDAGTTGFLVNSTGVAWTYDDASNSLEVAVTGIDHTLITDWGAAISGNIDTQLVAGDNIEFTYDNVNNTLTISTSVLDSTHTHVWDDITDAKTTVTLNELAYLSGVTPGTVTANRAVVVDGNKDISSFRNLTATDTINATTFSGNLVGDVTSDSVDINGGSIDGVIIGANSAAAISGTSINASVGFFGNLSGDVTGNADTASQVKTQSTATNTDFYLTFVDSNNGSPTAETVYTDSAIKYNPSTDTLTVTNIAGNIDSASTVSTETTDSGTHYLTFVDSDNSTAANETVRTDGDLSYDASTNTLSAGNVSVTGLISTNTLNTTGSVQIGGDLTVAGTTTTVNSTVVDIGDNIIRVNTSGLATGGIEVKDASNSSYKQFVWNNGNTRWELGAEDLQVDQLISTVASPTPPLVVTSSGLVTNLNADLLDNHHGSYYLDWNNTTNLPDPVITVGLNGDVVGTGTYTWTDLNGDPSITFNTTIQPDSVALGTDTTGQYASTITVTGSGLTGTTANASDGTAYTINSNATPANTPNAIVIRDSNGNFSAGTISATFSGDGSAITDINADNISTGTLNSARLPSVTQTNTATGPTGSFVSSVTRDSYGRVTGVNTTTHTLATDSVLGIASFSSSDFGVTSGAVSIKTGGVSNGQLENDSVTIGVTEFVLGDTKTAVSGLTQIAGTSSANPVYIEWAVIDGGTP